MRKLPVFWGIHAKPPNLLRWLLILLPFAVLVVTYMVASDYRHRSNPSDKLLPSVGKMVTAMNHAAFDKNKRTGEYQLLNDTLASMKRIGIGLGAAALLGLLCGLNLGLFPGMQHLFIPFVQYAFSVEIDDHPLAQVHDGNKCRV